MRRALVVQHPFNEHLGLLGEWAEHHGVELSTAEWAEDGLPAPTDFDTVVVLGSRESVYDAAVPWIAPELAWLDEALRADVPVLGICFGAQLLSAALGGEVSLSPERELGWYRVDSDDPDLVPPGPWWEYHSDRFTVPPGGVEIARTPVAPQAFVHGDHLGVQFHPEITVEMHRAWVEKKRDEVVALGFDPEQLLADSGEHASLHRTGALVDAFLARVAARRARVA